MVLKPSSVEPGGQWPRGSSVVGEHADLQVAVVINKLYGIYKLKHIIEKSNK